MAIADDLSAALLVSNADAIIAADAQGVIRFWNPGAERVFGFTAADAVGQSLDLIIPERQRDRHWRGYHHVMQTGRSRYGDGDILAVPGVRKDGTRISLEFTIVPLRDGSGGLTGMGAILRDVTTRFNELQTLRKKLAGSS
jgi:PAS domain S-box-containing protein